MISIITPSYNSGKYILRTIESVRMQNILLSEHIIVDGNSSDNTKEIISKYKNIIALIENDTGQSEALNKGLKLAKGDLIGWLNADDTYQTGTLAKVIDYFGKNVDVDLIFSDVNIIDEEDKLIGVSRSGPCTKENLIVSNTIKQPTVFFRRKIFDEIGGFNESLHFVMDWEYWLRARSQYNFQYIEGEIFANFRLVPGTKSFDRTIDFEKEWLLVLENLLKYNNQDNTLSTSLIKDQIYLRKIQILIQKELVQDQDILSIYTVIKSIFKLSKQYPIIQRIKKVWLAFLIIYFRNKHYDRLSKYENKKFLQIKY